MDAGSILEKIRQQARKRQATFYLKHKEEINSKPVSYTHLTLPTILRV